MESRGVRLRRYLIEQTGGRHGWVNRLADESGIKRQTLSAWMGDRTSPDLASIEALAKALGVRTWEVVAALEGDAVAVSPSEEAAIRAVVERVLDERLGPRKGRSR